MSAPRIVRYPAGTTFADYIEYQVNYVNYRTGWHIPGTELWIGDECRLRINTLGCKGPDLDPALGTIAYFGDSTVFGLWSDGWPFHVDVPGYQTLNTAVEGHCFNRMITRFRDLGARVPLDAVVVGGTWHNLLYNEHGEHAWAMFMGRFESAAPLAVCTLPTALTSECCARGLEPLVRGATGKAFRAWGTMDTDPAQTTRVYDAAMRYNAFVRRYCRVSGAILIDLYDVYRPPTYDAVPDMFEDPVHARAALYPQLAARARACLTPRLPVRQATVPTKEPAPRAGGAGTEGLPPQHVYPLW